MDNPASVTRVLVLDPDPAARDAARAALEQSFDIELFSDSRAALMRLSETDFLVMVVAEKLPDGTGAAFMVGARSRMMRPAAFLFLQSHDGPVATASSLGESEMVSGLAKPVDGPRLVRMVEQLARLAELRRSLASVARPTSRGGKAARPASTGAPIDARPISGGSPAAARPPSIATEQPPQVTPIDSRAPTPVPQERSHAATPPAVETKKA